MAPCEVNIETYNDIAIVRLKGTLEYENVVSVSQRVENVFQQGYNKVIIDMSQVTHANSKGMGSLISINRMSAEYKAKFLLLNPQGKALEVLNVTKLISVLDCCYGSQEDAIRQLNQ